MTGKKEKKEKEPAYYVSPVGVQTINYRVYYMSKVEKILYSILAFVVGGMIALLFYGGIGTDDYGNPTRTTYISNTFFFVVVGLIAVKIFIPIRTEQIQKKRQKALKNQFREMLDAISTSISSGQNVVGAFQSALNDMLVLYDEKDYIIQELRIINLGITNNIDIEKMLADFGIRSGIDDIESFAQVFETSYRKGGNINEIIYNTQQILNEKMEIENQIGIMVSTNKMEQGIMMVMPVGIIGMMKTMGDGFAQNFVSPSGLIATTIGIACFVAAYYVGKSVLNIKI